MLEYGYALRALGDARIVGVFNEAHGIPAHLPFDLAHRRWPIRFNLPADATTNRQGERQRLATALVGALRSILSQFEQSPQDTATGIPLFAVEPGDGVGRLRSANDFLCIGSGSDSKPIWLRPGPYTFLRLIPTNKLPELAEVEAYKIAQANLQPMTAMRGGGWSSGRHGTGAIVYWALQEAPTIAWDASELFLSRELWGNEFYHMNPERDRVKEVGFPYIPTGAVEEVIIDTFINFVRVASDQLGISPPVQIIAGLAGVDGFRLAADPQYFGYENFAGRILKHHVVLEATLNQWTVDPFDFLLPLFNKIYDSAGIVRPNVRVVGRRQR